LKDDAQEDNPELKSRAVMMH